MYYQNVARFSFYNQQMNQKNKTQVMNLHIFNISFFYSGLPTIDERHFSMKKKYRQTNQ